jgi:hypothetical protein
MASTPVEIYLRSVPYLPFRTYVCMGMVHFKLEVDLAVYEEDIGSATILLVARAKEKAIELGANAIIGVEFKDTLIEDTK